MVGQLTYGKRQWESLDKEMRELIPILDETSKDMIGDIDADTQAFNDYMVCTSMTSKKGHNFRRVMYPKVALKMPKGSDEEKARREVAMEAGMKKAVEVPMGLAKKAASLWLPLSKMASVGNLNCKSDLQVRDFMRAMAT